MKTYLWPESLTLWIDKHLKKIGFNINKSQALAKAILQTSNDYQEISSITAWQEQSTQAAYLAYFFPLNYIRSLKVIDEALRWDFFANSSHVVDFGCGPGTLTKALLNSTSHHWNAIVGVDLHSDLQGLYLDTPRSQTHLSYSQNRPNVHSTGSLLAASYVLNELVDLPPWLFDYEKIMILEPSTKQAFPQLLKLRDSLLEKNYHIIAPCPHSHSCPLTQSKKDWCHDRVHWQQPDWFKAIENHLPIKNRTLTFSYLLASKTAIKQPQFARVVGDAQIEKGKTRWMVCQGPEREFLSYLKRQGEAPDLSRGDRVQLDIFEKRGDEIRFNKDNFRKI